MSGWAERIVQAIGGDRVDIAADQVSTYFGSYTGRLFDRLATESSPQRFTAGDLYAVATLSAPIAPEIGVQLLDQQSDRCSQLLDQIPTDCPITDHRAREVLSDTGAATALYELLRDIPGVGPTRASKLTAVKRPALIPIRDSYVERVLGAEHSQRWWEPMVDAWSGESVPAATAALRNRIKARGGSIPAYVTDLRLVDVALWMCAEEAARK
jgi:Family of unknown function (DUF6308)